MRMACINGVAFSLGMNAFSTVEHCKKRLYRGSLAVVGGWMEGEDGWGISISQLTPLAAPPRYDRIREPLE